MTRPHPTSDKLASRALDSIGFNANPSSLLKSGAAEVVGLDLSLKVDVLVSVEFQKRGLIELLRIGTRDFIGPAVAANAGR